MDCSKYIKKEACVQAKVRVIPKADAGEVEFECIGEPKREACCDFMISQKICLRIHIKFSAEAAVVATGIVCEKQSQDCEPHPCVDTQEHEGLMFRKGYPESKPIRPFARNYLLTYRNNPEPT